MTDRYIPEHRRNNFKAKNTFKPDELRRRREEQQVEIRKAKREENLAKRRGIAGRDGGAPGASLGAALDSDDEGITIESQVSCLPPRSTMATFTSGLSCVLASVAITRASLFISLRFSSQTLTPDLSLGKSSLRWSKASSPTRLIYRFKPPQNFASSCRKSATHRSKRLLPRAW